MNVFLTINSCSVLVKKFCKWVHIPPFNQFSFLLKNVIVEFRIRGYHNWPSCQACPKYWTISKIAPPKKKKTKAINKNEKNKLLMVEQLQQSLYSFIYIYVEKKVIRSLLTFLDTHSSTNFLFFLYFILLYHLNIIFFYLFL